MDQKLAEFISTLQTKSRLTVRMQRVKWLTVEKEDCLIDVR